MATLPLDIASIDLDALVALRDAGTREDRSLDFKRDLVFKTDGEKKETLADISSFANARGGDILFGVDEDPAENGLMGAIVGISEDFDLTVRRLEESLSKGVNPRVPGIQYHPVFIKDGRYVLIVRVPKSRIAPHMVTYNETFRIFGRAASGKLTLSVQEIRDLVLATESLGERISRYRIRRAGEIVSGNSPAPLNEGPYVLVNLLPYDAFTGELILTIKRLSDEAQRNYVLPLGSGGDRWYPVFNGIVLPGHFKRSDSYAYLTSEGIAEGVNASFTFPEVSTINGDTKERQFFADEFLISEITRFLEQTQRTLLALGLGFPMLASVQFIGVSECYIFPRSHRQEAKPITEDVLDLGTVEILSSLTRLAWADALRPMFDRLANAGGHWRSPLYDEAGNLAVSLD